jgi:hypothetical protein
MGMKGLVFFELSEGDKVMSNLVDFPYGNGLTVPSEYFKVLGVRYSNPYIPRVPSFRFADVFCVNRGLLDYVIGSGNTLFVKEVMTSGRFDKNIDIEFSRLFQAGIYGHMATFTPFIGFDAKIEVTFLGDGIEWRVIGNKKEELQGLIDRYLQEKRKQYGQEDPHLYETIRVFFSLPDNGTDCVVDVQDVAEMIQASFGIRLKPTTLAKDLAEVLKQDKHKDFVLLAESLKDKPVSLRLSFTHGHAFTEEEIGEMVSCNNCSSWEEYASRGAHMDQAKIRASLKNVDGSKLVFYRTHRGERPVQFMLDVCGIS